VSKKKAVVRMTTDEIANRVFGKKIKKKLQRIVQRTTTKKG